MTFDAASLYDRRALGMFMAVLAFRAVPFGVWASIHVKARASTALGLVMLSGASVAAALCLHRDSCSGVAALLGALCYYVIANVGLHYLNAATCLGPTGRRLLWPILVAIYIALPAWSFCQQTWIAFVIVAYAFERALAAYSYCHAVHTRGIRPSLSKCLFFLTVNPELVFPSLPRACQPNFWRGCGRAIGGVLLMLVADVLGRMMPQKPAFEPAAMTAGMLHGASSFVLLYAMHAALAHMQIGFCRTIGYRAPERYDFPVGAVSPREFWARWNRYIGAWLQSYVYIPLARAAGDGRSRSRRRLVATMTAFIWLGAFHDAFWLVVKGSAVYSGLLGFCIWGLLGLAWTPIERLSNEAQGWRRIAVRETSRLVFLSLVSINVWIFA